MLETKKQQLLDQLLTSLTKEEALWTSGYLFGLHNKVTNQAMPTLPDLTILYITETGNAKFLALELGKKLKNNGAKVKLKPIEQYRLSDLSKEKNLILLTSTHGEGEIPEAGKAFFDHIQNNALNLNALNYLIIGLGDSNYPLFCQSGKDIDARFEALKGKRILDRIDLDLDFESHIESIFNQINVAFVGGEITQKPSIKTTQSNYQGTIITNINLNDIGSTKETRHIEISVEDGELNYEPGDSIGILLSNDDLKIEGSITPRLYSVASSVSEHGNEVHLTVSVLRYRDQNGEEVEGLFSNYLSRLKSGDNINFYISRNRHFRLPTDDKDIIMIGPGTGIAPFRSFIAERQSRLATGKNWLFFGERNAISDFLYQSEWQDHLASGLLTQIDVAFSRDQETKIYVQDRIKEKAESFFKWLENGAYLYLCGDKENMARDVEKQLLEVIQTQGNHSEEDAKRYVENLTHEGRYLKDVY